MEQHTKAKFWKCALQVNPSSYITYRGADHNLTEEEYNRELLRVAKENNIRVIGLADHGNVDGVDPIRNIMNQNGILVFPGFEIASSEKAHFVCLFNEETTRDELISIMAKLEVDIHNPTQPSKLSAVQIVSKVDELQGFIYAAHCTDDNGVLNRKLNHVWRDPKLKAAQIPGTLDELGGDNGFKQILLNKNPDYRRETPIAIINAKDVARPEDLANPKASCLIKMTRPCFDSFKLAFQDAESRVRLNSDVSENYYSRIERLKVTGGYLDGIDIELSEHLNAVIGGRGTGKSTLLECIRYALGLAATGKRAQKQHDDIIRENVGKSKARIELVIRSSRMNGKRFTVARRFGENPVVIDEDGNISALTPSDLLPEVKIFGQNEVYEVAQDEDSQRQLLAGFLKIKDQELQTRIEENLRRLKENRSKLVEAWNNMAEVQDEVSRLPKLEEQLGHFKALGLEEKLKMVPLLEEEKLLMKRVTEEVVPDLNRAFQSVRDSLPNTVFLNDANVEHLPHAEVLRKMRTALDRIRHDAEILLTQWYEKYTASNNLVASIAQELHAAIQKNESTLEDTFKELPSSEGKSGKEIGIEFQNLVKEIERIRPKRALIENQTKIIADLKAERKTINENLSKLRSERAAQITRELKRLNKRLLGKLKLLKFRTRSESINPWCDWDFRR
ncbi:hypothetical protein GCM10025857_26910 [Alicyclobacillus contaminans]|uniref:AAA family ATPase n=1 Tax=Alicyclobacillus contaminans TaxID=392016 RepID=UPI000417175F|nr:AAA family ATPase [Alicyclobacillus contaminans]GMA51334.1 hypothetical protein GCM10025857_26910 [Alicyclobacillus contaminans]